VTEQKEVLRRIADRGLALAQRGAAVPYGFDGAHAEHLDLWQHMLDEIARLPAASRGPCAHCGDDNPRGGAYCSDRCRARHARMHAPGGRVRSSRSLASGGWSIVVHFPQAEAERGASFRVKDEVFVVEGEE
jgi:hypothetical protein